VRDSIYFTDFNDPRYGTPGPNEFILHVDNRSLRDTVTYVFQRTGTGESSDPSPSGGVPTGTVTTKLAGVWTGYMAGKMSGQSQVLQTGRSLTFINEFGSRSQGTFKNETTVVATDWEGGLHGQLVEGGRRINWANNTWWILKESSDKPIAGKEGGGTAMPIQLAGVWTSYMAGKMSGQSQVLQTGRSLTFINEFGSRSQGTFKNETTVVATDWEGGLHGQLVEGGRRINWANNTWWILKESSNKR
jgi:hypothetical protein